MVTLLIISYQNVVGNYNFLELYGGFLTIISYQNVVGNYNPLCYVITEHRLYHIRM